MKTSNIIKTACLSGITLLAVSTNSANASTDCDYDTEIDRIRGLISDSTTSVNTEVCGYSFAVVSNTQASGVPGLSIAEGSINGIPVRIETTASSFDSTDISRDTVAVYVNGNEVYRGIIDNADINEGLRLLGSLGVLDSAAVTQTEVQKSSVATVSRTVNRRVQQFLTNPTTFSTQISAADGNGQITGLAGGDESTGVDRRFGLWGNISNSWLDDDSLFGSFDGTLTSITTGLDYRVLDNVLAGIAVTGEMVDLDTHFNSGGLDSKGLIFTPYIGAAFLDQQLIANFLVGYGLSSVKTERLGYTVNGTQFTAQQVDADFWSRRVFLSSDLSGNFQIGDLTLSPRAGYTMAWDSRNSVTESDGTVTDKNDTVVGTISAAARATYTIGSFAPYIETIYSYDAIIDEDIVGVQSLTTQDRDEVVLVGGLTWQAADDMMATFEVSNSFGRENFSNTTVSAALRWEF